MSKFPVLFAFAVNFFVQVQAGAIRRPEFIMGNPEGEIFIHIGDPSDGHINFLLDEEDESQSDEKEDKVRMLEALQQIDSNGDESLQFKEILAWAENTAKELDDDQYHRKFYSTDQDRSDTISWNEYLKVAFDIDNEEEFYKKYDTKSTAASVKREMLSTLEQEKALFQMVDGDESGDLNSTEFHTFFHPAEFEESLDFLVSKIFERDLNKDGKLSFKEYTFEDEAAPRKIFTRTRELEKFNNEIDKTGDGFVRKWELISYLSNPLVKKIRTEVSKLVKCADENLDGSLSFEEILNHQHSFERSKFVKRHLKDEL